MARERPSDFAVLPRQAQVLIFTTVLVGAGMAIAGTVVDPGTGVDLQLLLVAVLLCGGANLFEVFAPGHYSLQPNFAFFFWGAVLLPPWAIVVLAIACFLPSIVLRRLPWFKTLFSVALHALPGLAAHAVAWSGAALPMAPRRS